LFFFLAKCCRVVCKLVIVFIESHKRILLIPFLSCSFCFLPAHLLAYLLTYFDNLHDYLRFTYPHIAAPSFFCQSETANGLLLRYRSRRRGFVPYVVGQIREVASLYYTHPFNGPFSGTTRVSRYQKGKNQCGFY